MNHHPPAIAPWSWSAHLPGDEPCRWYAIADAAQHKALPGALVQHSQLKHRCLFDTAKDSPIAAHSPHLVTLPVPAMHNEAPHAAWKWIERYAPDIPCISVLASSLDFDDLHRHLSQWTEVLLPDGEDMFFAFWDPMILGTLMGQTDDRTLYVAGPVLNEAQRAGLTAGIESWSYWDRDGHIRVLQIDKSATLPASNPLQLTYQQMDMLVEASVPDHVLHYVELNQAHLLSSMDACQRYSIVREHLTQAKTLGLTGMGDMVNYVCAALIYGPAIEQDPQITGLLEQVRTHRLTLDQALEAMP
jgi:hypothetical protein